MNDWGRAELDRLRHNWPDLRCDVDTGWVVIPGWRVPLGWTKPVIDIAVRIPENIPGQEPYGFWVRGGIQLAGGQGTPSNYTFPGERVSLAPEDEWGQFSWALETWAPGAMLGEGTTMVHFVHSIGRRLEELN